jgi:two-component system, OmpR family, sensor histidine kinase KdpD
VISTTDCGVVPSTFAVGRRAGQNGGSFPPVVATHPPASECLVVCLGPSPTSERLVRAAHQLAASIGARWYAVHVALAEAPPLPPVDRDRVEGHLALAESLGADVSYLIGHTVAGTVLAFARERGATRIVAGKPTHPRWRDRVRGSLLEALIRDSGPIELHIIAPSGEVPPRSAGGSERRRWTAYAPGLAAIAVVTVLGVLVRDRLSLPDQAMLYLAAIMIAALAGRAAGVLAAALSVAAYNFFFIPPYHTFEVADLDHRITFVVMFLVGIATGGLVARLRHAEAATLQRERRSSALLALTAQTAAADDAADIGAAVVAQVEDALGLPAVVLVPREHGLHAVAGLEPLAAQEMAVAQAAHDQRRAAGRGTDISTSAKLLAVPLWVGSETVGVVAVQLARARRRIDLEARALLEAIARHAGVAIARLTLAGEAREAALRARAEELRSSLLSTVSHDLRTPLAVITGMATALRDAAPNLTADQRESLDTIVDEAARLGAILHNLLAITRVESGVQLGREWVPLEELVGAALGRLEARLAAHRVDLDIDAEACVLVDPMLFEQVLLNLLENAAKHTAAGTLVEISGRRRDAGVVIEVSDRGAGLPSGAPDQLFEKFYRGHGVRGAGAGLGLAVCRGIVLAHGGRIEAEQRAGGGATFRVCIAGGAMPVPALPEPVERVAS